VGPKYKTPTVPTPPAYKEIGNWKTAQPSDQNLGGNWWEIFQDPQLNALEQQINVSNQNLKAAVAQYQGSRAALRYARADYYPTLSAAPSATREKFSANRPGSVAQGKTFNDFVFPVDLSYQTNAWGRVSKNVESFREQAQASAADLAVVNLTMHADLAVDYFAARTLDAEEKLLQNTVAQYEQALQLNEERYKGGLASEVEVEQARTILETTQAQLIDLGVARAQFEHAAAVLVGKPPANFSLPPLPLTTPPAADSGWCSIGVAGEAPGYRSWRASGSLRECTSRSCQDCLLPARKYFWLWRIREWRDYDFTPGTQRLLVSGRICIVHHL
jgi:outer membrane protein TolC